MEPCIIALHACSHIFTLDVCTAALINMPWYAGSSDQDSPRPAELPRRCSYRPGLASDTPVFWLHQPWTVQRCVSSFEFHQVKLLWLHGQEWMAPNSLHLIPELSRLASQCWSLITSCNGSTFSISGQRPVCTVGTAPT